MIPEMPGLIPTKNVPKLSPLVNSPHPSRSPESPPKHHPYIMTPSDDKLHKDLDYQIQLVKTIQELLWTEKNELERMLTEVHSRNAKRKCEEEEPMKKRRGRPPGRKTTEGENEDRRMFFNPRTDSCSFLHNHANCSIYKCKILAKSPEEKTLLF